MKNLNIFHVTSVHIRSDNRIFNKYCKNSSDDLETNLVVFDGQGSTNSSVVNIIDLGFAKSFRFLRVVKIYLKLKNFISSKKNSIFHFHDPELILFIFFKYFVSSSNKFVYDMHEESPKQILDNLERNFFLRYFLSFSVFICEFLFLRFFDGCIGATPHIKGVLDNINKNVIGIYNYILKNEINHLNDTNDYNSPIEAVYIGGIDKLRGIDTILDNVNSLSKVKFHIVGNFVDKTTKNYCVNHPNWNKIKFHGYKTREYCKNLMSKCHIGLLLFKPARNHNNALPNKIFEYLASDLFIVHTNFPSWKLYIKEDVGKGVSLDFKNYTFVMNSAVKLLLGLKKRINNNKLIKKYTWESQEKTLSNFYKEL